MEELLGPLLALLSAVAYGAADFAGGFLSRRRAAAGVVGVSQACSLIVLLVILALVGWPSAHGWVPWSVLAGAAGALGLVLFYRALAIGTVGVVSPIAATGALVGVVVGIVQGERPGALVTAGMVLALLGAVFAAGPELRSDSEHAARSVLLACGAAVGFGLTIVAIARGSAVSPLATMAGMRATSVCGFAVAAVASRSLGGIQARDLPKLAALGITDTGANLLVGLATTMGMLSLTTVLSSLYPVVTVGLAAVLLHERLLTVQKAGVAAALGGVALIAAG